MAEKRIEDRNGNAMGFLKLEDGYMDVTLFSRQWLSYKSMGGKIGSIIRLFGRVEAYNGQDKFLADNVEVL